MRAPRRNHFGPLSAQPAVGPVAAAAAAVAVATVAVTAIASVPSADCGSQEVLLRPTMPLSRYQRRMG